MLTNYRALTDQRLPLGWRTGALPKTGSGWLAALLGWLLVALGVSMGAPFWFDVLSRFANLKLSGNHPRPNQGSVAARHRPADDTPLARYILRRLVDSWVNPSAARFLTWSTRDDQTLHALTGHELDVATAALDQGQPVPLGLIAADAISGIGHNHQVLAIGYDRHFGGAVDLLIYDNNTHDETVTLAWHPGGTGILASNRDSPWRGCFLHSYSRQDPPDTFE